MDSITFLIMIALTAIIIIAILFFAFFRNKKMNQEHEIEIIQKLEKQNSKKIKALSEYKKASKTKTSSHAKRFVNYLAKMIFTLF